MGELYGWAGTVLHVDLSSGEVRRIDTAQYVPGFVGGAGLAARIAWDLLACWQSTSAGLGMGAFDPESPLFLMVGALPAMWHSHHGMLVNSLVLCDREHSRVFGTTSEDGKADTGLMARLFSACTGFETSEGELNRSGERIWYLLRAIDVRFFGRDRAVDESTLDAFMYPGKDDGVMLDRERFVPLLDTYYALSGWDPATGWPMRAKLEELGLGDVAGVMQSEKKLG